MLRRVHFRDMTGIDLHDACVHAVRKAASTREPAAVKQLHRTWDAVLSGGPYDTNFVIVDDGVEAVCYGEDRSALKLLAHELLDATISVNINARSRLIHQEYLRTAKHGARHTYQLPLPDTEAVTALGHCAFETAV